MKHNITFCKIFEYEGYQCLVALYSFFDENRGGDVNELIITVNIGSMYFIDTQPYKSLSDLRSAFDKFSQKKANKLIIDSFNKAPVYCQINLV